MSPRRPSPRSLSRWALAGLAALAAGCTEAGARQDLYLNLFPVGDEDPFAELDRLVIALEPGGPALALEDFEPQTVFEPLAAGGSRRLELRGLGGAERLAWGFSPPLRLGGGARKASLLFSRDDTAVAHAGPALVDPLAGLAPAELPLSLYLDGLRASLAYNHTHLYLELEVTDAAVVGNDPWDAGDRVIVSLDGRSFQDPGLAAYDDLVLVFGPERYVELWNPQAAAPIVRDFRPTPDGAGYQIYAAIPLELLLPPTDNQSPGPSRSLGLGIERHDVDPTGGDVVSRWPAGWQPGEQPHAFALDPGGGAGSLALKTRVLDARQVPAQSVGFEPGLDRAFLDSGAVPLGRTPLAGEDEVRVYALWDASGLLVAVASADRVACAQDREPEDSTGLLRDDAVELVLAPTAEQVYRAVSNLVGSTETSLNSSEAWEPELYFRFDLAGPVPEDDCREIDGWTFKLRVPWTDLGYVGQPPALGDTLAFDLVIHDHDRGARVVSPFSPMGPTLEPQQLAELRLFAY